MRDVDSREVVEHLTAERDWYDSSTAHLRSLVEELEAEMVSRTASMDIGVSWTLRECVYYTRYVPGKDYPQFLRENPPSDLPNVDETVAAASSSEGIRGDVLLDANLLAGDSGYLDLGQVRLSPDQQLLAYSVDSVGDEIFTLRFRDLRTGQDLEDLIPGTYYGGAWSADAAYFFYTVTGQAHRPHQVWRHRLGTPTAEDQLVLEEPDARFELHLRPCRSGDVIVAWSGSRDTSEVWALDARNPEAPARSVGGRRPGVEYHAEHVHDGDRLLVVTNDDAPEFRLASAPTPRAADQDWTSWSELRPEDPRERLERVDAFASHVVLRLRRDGLRAIRILPLDDLTGAGIDLTPTFAQGTLDLGLNADYDATVVTVRDSSYVHPPVWSDVDLHDGTHTARHRQAAPGHEPERYVSERLEATSVDGATVGITVVRHRDTPLDGTAPAVLYGYGAYEYVFESEWDPALPSLLDRGVVFAHAHVRGGGEGGRRWWLDGRLEHKQHTFDDFIAAAERLDGVVDGTRIASRGLSAGGLLQGAVFSQRPGRWRAVVAEVPFVDVVTTMFDPSIPLTINEWDEWGDPRTKADFDAMMAYSPYDNLPPAGARPDLLVTGALHDPRVMVWEPAKWVAALRESDPAWSPMCLFRCEVGAGSHVGPSGRFGHLAYEAEVYAWLLERLTR